MASIAFASQAFGTNNPLHRIAHRIAGGLRSLKPSARIRKLRGGVIWEFALIRLVSFTLLQLELYSRQKRFATAALPVGARFDTGIQFSTNPQ